MKYRAVLIDPGDKQQERPVEVLGNHRPELERWAHAVLARAVSDSAVVNIYMMVEQHVAIIPKTKAEVSTVQSPVLPKEDAKGRTGSPKSGVL